MKKRIVAFALVITMVWGVMGEQLSFGRSAALAEEGSLATSTDLGPAENQEADPEEAPETDPEADPNADQGENPEAVPEANPEADPNADPEEV